MGQYWHTLLRHPWWVRWFSLIGSPPAVLALAQVAGIDISWLLFRQRIWQTMRQKAITLRGIDQLFAVVEDPTCFASKEIYFKAKLATAMAMATWYDA